MILDPRERQLPDESVVMRYPIRAYQTDQPSACRPFCYQHAVQNRNLLSKHLTGQYISGVCAAEQIGDDSEIFDLIKRATNDSFRHGKM
jgi:predicted metalloprotease